MKKKITALSLIAAILLSSLFVLTSCEKSPLDGDDADKAIAYVNEKMDELKSCTMEMAVNVKVGGTAVSTTAATMKIDFDKDSPKFSAEGSVTAAGETTRMDIVYINDTSYVSVGSGVEEVKYKSSGDQEGYLDMISGLFEEESESETSLNAQFVSRENGVYVIRYDLSKDDIQEMMGEDGDELASLYQNLTASCTFYVNKDGYATKAEIRMNGNVQGVAMTVDYDMEFKDFNSSVTITAPEDADEYQNMSGLLG